MLRAVDRPTQNYCVTKHNWTEIAKQKCVETKSGFPVIFRNPPTMISEELAGIIVHGAKRLHSNGLEDVLVFQCTVFRDLLLFFLSFLALFIIIIIIIITNEYYYGGTVALLLLDHFSQNCKHSVVYTHVILDS